MSTEEVVVKFFDAICEYGRPGRLGKTFQTKNNYYFLDAGTGKVAKIGKSVYDILTTLLESDDVIELLKLSMDSNELIQGIEEIQEAIKTEHILSANKFQETDGFIVDLRYYPSIVITYLLNEYINPTQKVFAHLGIPNQAYPGAFFTKEMVSGKGTMKEQENKIHTFSEYSGKDELIEKAVELIQE